MNVILILLSLIIFLIIRMLGTKGLGLAVQALGLFFFGYVFFPVMVLYLFTKGKF
jgi:hypothetical protein